MDNEPSLTYLEVSIEEEIQKLYLRNLEGEEGTIGQILDLQA